MLNQKGVDTSHVQKTKAELALWTLEHIAKTKKKKSTVMSATKEAAKSLVPHKSGGEDGEDEESEESEEDKALKREILFGRKKEEERRQEESAENEAKEKKDVESKSGPAAEQSGDGQPTGQAAEESSARQGATSQDGDAAANVPTNPEPPAEDQVRSQQDEARDDADSSLRANASTEPNNDTVPPSPSSLHEDAVSSPQPDQAHAHSDV
ncbi:hypothetical protein PENSPDRAFT_3593 [Peniophora sp. CONT]|nr:hypothetical protein PENSPDRAFT_3593 [Peniophora sp. CONT]